MSETYELTWDGFLDFVHEADGITVRETNPEQSFVTIEDLGDTDPRVVAELFVAAHDSGVYVGAFDVEDDDAVDFYPGGDA